MKVEDQVCSIESAKRLKELGVKVSSFFFYEYDKTFDEILISSYWYIENDFYQNQDDRICAYSVAELSEMLPEDIKSSDEFYFLKMGKCYGW